MTPERAPTSTDPYPRAETHGRAVPRRGLASRSKLVLLGLLVVLVGVLLWRLGFLETLRARLIDALGWIKGLGGWAPVIFILLYAVLTVLLLPGSVLTIAAGFLFGLAGGTACVSAASMLGATSAFLIGRYAARGWVARKVEANPRFKAVDEAVAAEGWKIVALTRLSPAFPFVFLNYAYGLTKVSLRAFFFASWVCMLPGTVLYVYLGSLGEDLATLGAGGASGWERWTVNIVGFLATVGVTVYVTRIARRALTQRVDASGDRAAAGGAPTAGTAPAGESRMLEVPPMDGHNRTLVENVHPPAWVSPEPAPCYNLVAIGAGTAGLVTAAGAAGLGARVALIERHLMGGDCLNVGCVPSKALIRASRAAHDVRAAGEFGVRVPAGVEVDFGAVMARMREIRARISRNDSARRFRDLGVDVFLGEARFLDGRTLEVGGRTLRFKKAVIATGARAAVPPIPGLEEAGFLTNETVFTLTERPRRLAVIGGGPIGSELAQAFRRLGSDVLLIEMGPHILGREDADAAAIVERQFEKEGIRLRLRSALARVERSAEGKVLHLGSGEAAAVDEILIGVGRAPNVEGLGLEAAGVRYDARTGIEVNDRLETSAANIYAAGDVAMSWKFTHAADFAARIVIQNALFPGPKARLSSLTMPWCTYTDPEVAHVGMYGHEAAARGIEIDTFEVALSDVDRALADGEEEGFVKVHVRKGSDRILGATIVARHAGEMISELSVAMKAGAGLGAIARTIHPYPTQAEAIRKAGDLYQKTRLTPFRRQALSRWFQWTR